MNINILRYSLFGIAGGQEVDLNFSQMNYLPSCNDCIRNYSINSYFRVHPLLPDKPPSIQITRLPKKTTSFVSLY